MAALGAVVLARPGPGTLWAVPLHQFAHDEADETDAEQPHRQTNPSVDGQVRAAERSRQPWRITSAMASGAVSGIQCDTPWRTTKL